VKRPVCNDCPTPTAHSRLLEVHRLWHQAADNYNDPDGFRTYLNATLQALRNVTFAIQSEKNNIPNFDEWYPQWQQRLKSDSVLKWVNDARVTVVHKSDLEIYSSASITIHTNIPIANAKVSVPPCLNSEEIISYILHKEIPIPIVAPEFVLTIERQWGVSELPGVELLQALAHAYSVLCLLVEEAHQSTNSSLNSCRFVDNLYCYNGFSGSLDDIPVCMMVNKEIRTANLSYPDGNIMSPVSEAVHFKPETTKKALKQYRVDKSLRKRMEQSTDIFSFATVLIDMSKKVLAKDKYHLLMVFIKYKDRYEIRNLFPTTKTEKYILWKQVANEVRRIGSDGIIVIGEAWKVPEDEYRKKSVPPELHPSRREALTVSIATANGEYLEYTTEFSRNVFGKIKFQPTYTSNDGVPYYLAPIYNVWGIKLPTINHNHKNRLY